MGTVSIEKSERLSNLLHQRKIPHQVLNAKHHEKKEIVAQAGKKERLLFLLIWPDEEQIFFWEVTRFLAREEMRSKGLRRNNSRGRRRLTY